MQRDTPYRYYPIVSDVYRFTRRYFNLWRYSGSDYFCPVCSNGWKRSTRGSSCPWCGSATRHKALILWLETYIAKQMQPIRTLLFAPDFGVENWLRKHSQIELTTTDYSAPNVDYNWDITNLPIDEQSYDLVLCSHVMEHVPDDAKAFGELFRILKKDGLLLLQVPYRRDEPLTDEDDSVTDPDERTSRFGQFDHVRRYGQDIVSRMQSQRLTCEVLSIDSFLEPHQIERFDLWNDVLFVCRRSKELLI